MSERIVSVDDAIDFLNELLRIDPIATNSLFSAVAPCNDEVVNHPTIQVMTVHTGGLYMLRLMGVLNGLFGCDGEKVGYIAAFYNNGQIEKFLRTVRNDDDREC